MHAPSPARASTTIKRAAMAFSNLVNNAMRPAIRVAQSIAHSRIHQLYAGVQTLRCAAMQPNVPAVALYVLSTRQRVSVLFAAMEFSNRVNNAMRRAIRVVQSTARSPTQQNDARQVIRYSARPISIVLGTVPCVHRFSVPVRNVAMAKSILVNSAILVRLVSISTSHSTALSDHFRRHSPRSPASHEHSCSLLFHRTCPTSF